MTLALDSNHAAQPGLDTRTFDGDDLSARPKSIGAASRVHAEQVRLSYGHTATNVAGGSIAGALLCWVFWPVLTPSHLIGWVACLWFAYAAMTVYAGSETGMNVTHAAPHIEPVTKFRPTKRWLQNWVR